VKSKKSLVYLQLLTLISTGAIAQTGVDAAKMEKKYRDSLVYLKVEKMRKDNGNIEVFSGTGFVISNEGHILTSCHIVALNNTNAAGAIVDFVNVTVTGAEGSKNGQFEPIEKIRCDDASSSDMALLKFKNTARKRRPVELDVKFKYKSALPVASMGFPLDIEFFSKRGEFGGSAPGDRYLVNMNLTTGDSGAPIFDRRLKVIGMVNSGYDGTQIGVISPLRHATFLLAYAGIDSSPVVTQANLGDSILFKELDGKVLKTYKTASFNDMLFGSAIEDDTTVSVKYPISALSPKSFNEGRNFDLKTIQALPGYKITSSHFVVTSSKFSDAIGTSVISGGDKARVALQFDEQAGTPHLEGYISTIQKKTPFFNDVFQQGF
jgi:hypothetical protein